jgi:hypothetical protein
MKRFAIAGILLFVGGITIGSALTPRAERATASSNGQRVCIHKKTGVMRLASVKKCSGSETSKVFGAPGDTGSQGPPGPEGPAGPAGTASSAAVVKTKNVTLRYSSSSGTFGGCGDGTGSFGSSGRIYSGSFFGGISTSSYSWSALSDCSITLKVVDE